MNLAENRAARPDTAAVRWEIWLWLGLVVVAIAAFHSTIVKLVDLWRSNPEYSHGFFVPLLTLSIYWTRREEISRALSQKQPVAIVAMGAAIILLGGGLRVAGIFSRALSVEGISMPLVLAGISFAAMGFVTAFRMLPVTLFLVFMVPVPGVFLDRIAELLQGVATHASTFCFQLIGIPALSDGIVIALPNTDLQIAEACSGIRMLITLATMVTAYCIVSQRTLFEKILLLLSVMPIAVAVNVLRIVSTGAAHECLPAWAEIVHDASGWFMMVTGMLLLLFELRILGRLILKPASE